MKERIFIGVLLITIAALILLCHIESKVIDDDEDQIAALQLLGSGTCEIIDRF